MSIQTKVLIVEDNDEDATQIRMALENMSCDFQRAQSLDEANDRTLSFEPEIVIMDVCIPKAFGAGDVIFSDILEYIRRFKDKSATVILTGHVDPVHVDQAMLAGAVDYIDKEKLLNRPEFEARIRDAHTLHTALILKDNVAKILVNQAHTRASLETLITLVRQQKMLTGKVQEEKDVLLRRQQLEAGIQIGLRRANLKFATKWGSICGGTSVFLYFCWSFIKGAVLAWKK